MHPAHPVLFVLIATIIFSVGVIVGAVLARRPMPAPRPRRLNDAAILARINQEAPPGSTLARLVRPEPNSTPKVEVGR